MGDTHQRAPRILGLMSGTSADGVDAVLLELPGLPLLGSSIGSNDGSLLSLLSRPAPRARVLAEHYSPYPDDLRAEVLAAGRDQLKTSALAQLHSRLGAFLAEAARPLAPQADLIASHGQTVYHIPAPDPSRGWHTRSTLQLGEAAIIAEVTRKPVVADFRPQDLAAGGQAAPFVPFADWLFFADANIRRAIHNLGGISNLTYLPNSDPNQVLAFDSGPANCLSDEAAELVGLRFDDGGKLASSGTIQQDILKLWLADEYLLALPPKSTGRERFSRGFLPGALALTAADLAATGLEYAAQSIAHSYARFVLPRGLDEVIVAGGGVHNPLLMRRLRQLLPVPVLTFAEKGWESAGFSASSREAAAFALMGYCMYQGWPNTLPSATGARRAVIAGKLIKV
jgi:anhydro-N-acetylmuramic acid kinase